MTVIRAARSHVPSKQVIRDMPLDLPELAVSYVYLMMLCAAANVGLQGFDVPAPVVADAVGDVNGVGLDADSQGADTDGEEAVLV